MKREILIEILEQSSGLKKDGAQFIVCDRHLITLYLGKPGSGMVVGDVQKLVPKKSYLEFCAKDKGVFYVEFETVYGISEKSDAKGSASRSGVGFS